MINDAVEGVDTYKTKDSTWIIFTESKKWVIELTKDGTLWYNYNFFNDLMMYLSMDVVENQHYITKWVEDNVINKVKYTTETSYHRQDLVEDTIQNGVKETRPMEGWVNSEKIVDKTIQNGVKDIKVGMKTKLPWVEDTIQNGVKETCCHDMKLTKSVEKIIKNTYSDILPKEYDWSDQFDVKEVIETGVKHTEYGDWEDGDERFDDIIQNGIKETLDDLHHRINEGIKETIGEDYHHRNRIDGVIKNGIKQTKSINYSDNAEFIVDGVIKKGKII